VENPFAKGRDDQVLYHTGDLVRMERNALGVAQLVYLGRKDFQLKLRGLRIEPGEIEQQLRALPGVEDAQVLVDSDQLVGFALVPHETTAIDGWREALFERLPDYMVPRQLVTVSQWPLTPNGKIDRARLLALPRSSSATGFVAPRTTLEKDIAAIWQEVLGIGKAGVFDNFFEAGEIRSPPCAWWPASSCTTRSACRWPRSLARRPSPSSPM
jgi:enterobactin synthetase component F